MAQLSPRNHTIYLQTRISPIEESTEYWYPAPRRSLFHRLLWLWVVCGIVLALFFLTIGAGLYLWAKSDIIIYGVHANGVNVGGLRTGEAKSQLEKDWEQTDIRLEIGGSTWRSSPADLGLSLNSDFMVQQAWATGRRTGDTQHWLLNGASLNVEPLWTFDAQKAESFLYGLAPQVTESPVDAGIEINNGRAEMTPPIAGRVLDVPATLSILRANPEIVLASGRLPLVVQAINPNLTDTSDIVDEANRRLDTNFTLTLFDPIRGESNEVLIKPEEWSRWLTLEINTRGELDWVLNPDHLTDYLDDLNETVGLNRYLETPEVQNAISKSILQQENSLSARLYHKDGQHVVAPGETLSSIGRRYGVPYPYIQQANGSLADQLYPGQILVIPSPDVMLPLPVVADKRIIVNIEQQRVQVYDHGELKWDWLASTGIDSSPTAPGIFQIQSHEINAYATNWDLWMPNFMGVYRPVPGADFMNGFHGFPTRNGYSLLWTGDLGHQVTYGCILLSSENAELLYDWADEGIIVEIQG